MFTDRLMNKEDVMCVHTHTHTHTGILLSHKKEQNYAICSNMDATRESHIKWSKSDICVTGSLCCAAEIDRAL